MENNNIEKENKSLIDTSPLFVFRFVSGTLSKKQYAVTAKTMEDALEKLKIAIGEDDVKDCNFESMTEWKIENAKN